MAPKRKRNNANTQDARIPKKSRGGRSTTSIAGVGDEDNSNISLQISLNRESIRELLEQYDAALEQAHSRKKSGNSDIEQLRELDHWRRDELPALLVERRPDPYLTASELVKIVECKLKRGTFRPTLLAQAQAHDDATVRETTKAAFGLLSSSSSGESHSMSFRPASVSLIHEAMKKLTSLKGIGPATASLILQVDTDSDVPFYADETVMTLFGIQKNDIKYTMKDYDRFLERIDALAAELNAESNGTNNHIQRIDIERTLWVQTILSQNKSSK